MTSHQEMRSGSPSDHEANANMDVVATVSHLVDRLGTGYYQLMVMIGVGCAALSESVEMGATAPMHTALTRAFNLSDAVRTALPAFTIAGSALGMLVAGPVCDRFGRKAALVMSNISIALVMSATAMLPTTAGPKVVLWLRFMAGLSGAIGVPAGIVLAVESAPHAMRARLLIAISFLSCCGYLLCAVGLEIFMPYLGESPHDSWRSFYFFVAIPSIVSLPFLMGLCESPSFLAVKGERDRCVQVLCHIAKVNGRQLSALDIRLPDPPEEPKSLTEKGVLDVIIFNACLLVLLSFVDGCRGYFVAGSSYVWKDYFELATAKDSVKMKPAALNIVASFSPLVGLLIGERMMALGARRVTFICSFLATCALVALTAPSVKEHMWPLLWIIVTVKLTYGPISTCVQLMKTEAFPTEVRASAFALISVVGKVGCALAPTVIESLKQEETADSWQEDELNHYTLSLAIAVMAAGVVFMFVPGESCEEAPLEDYVFEGSDSDDGEKSFRGIRRQLQKARSYGSFGGFKDNYSQPGRTGSYHREEKAFSPRNFDSPRKNMDDSSNSNLSSSSWPGSTSRQQKRKALLSDAVKQELANPPKPSLTERLANADALPFGRFEGTSSSHAFRNYDLDNSGSSVASYETARSVSTTDF